MPGGIARRSRVHLVKHFSPLRKSLTPSRRQWRQTASWYWAIWGQTLRRLGGRQPLCGIGVTSVIAVTSRPAAWSERMAASRPEPGPLTKVSICFKPCSIALRAVASAVTWAAKGVLLREPLKPWLPALPQARILPWLSVSDTIVLLNVDWICACPTVTFFFSRRRVRTTFFFGMTYFFASAFLRTPTVLRGPRRVRALV